jgi:hypothetical protein
MEDRERPGEIPGFSVAWPSKCYYYEDREEIEREIEEEEDHREEISMGARPQGQLVQRVAQFAFRKSGGQSTGSRS